MSKAKETLDAALNKLKKEIEKEPMCAERVRALVDASKALFEISSILK